jgi:hypothetical protein
MSARHSWYGNWKVWLGILISLGAIWWTFRDADFRGIAIALGRANWLILILIAPLQLLGVIQRAWRWDYFIGGAPTSFRSRYNATSIGFLITSILPLRLGEIARALVFARNTRRSRMEILTTIGVERLFDLLALGVLFVIVLPHVPVEAIRAGAGDEAGLLGFSRETLMFGSTLFVVFGLLGFLLLCQFGRRVGEFLLALLKIERPRIRRVFTSFFDGIEALWRGRKLVQTLISSILIWLNTSICFWLAMLAFPSGETTLGAIMGITGAIFLDIVVCAGVALPSAPGFFGVWHAATRVAFIPYPAAEPDVILAFAITIHMLSYILTIILGIEAFKNEGVQWSDMKKMEDESGDDDS